MSERSDETRPGQPADPGGVTQPWSPGQPQRYQPPQDRPFGQQGQPFSPAGQQGIQPAAPGTQYATPGTFQRPPSPGSAATQDRLAVHLIWEGVLLVITAALVGAAVATTPQAHFADVIRPAGYIGLVAAGLALSLRTGTPNLAVGSIASATGVLGAHLAITDRWPLWAAMTVAVLIAAVAGLIAGLVVAGLSVPAWAVTLAAAFLVQAAALGLSNAQPVVLHITGSYPTALWLAIFAAVSVGGGALWLIPGVRTALSATRNAGEPGQWAGLRAGLGAVAGLTGSSLLAGVGGVSLAIYLEAGDPSSGGINLTFIALAAALIGGVSVFGRRAGVLGTVLGTGIVTTVLFLLNVHAVSPYWLDVPIGGLAVLGLVVSRALESITNALNRPPAPGIVPPTRF